jgi:hypothetical protein
MSYVDIVIRPRPLPILETWPPIYRGQERTVRDRLKASQVYSYVYFRYTPCLTDFTFEFIRHPIPPILSPSYWTFVELTLVRLAVSTQQVQSWRKRLQPLRSPAILGSSSIGPRSALSHPAALRFGPAAL